MQKSKLTKLLCLVLSLMMILCAAPITVFAADTSLTGFSGGDGTESNPYQIASKAELEKLANIVNGGNNCADTYFRLTADIGTEAAPVTTAIGNSETPFAGHFDGAGHTVTLNIEAPMINIRAELEKLGVFLTSLELEDLKRDVSRYEFRQFSRVFARADYYEKFPAEVTDTIAYDLCQRAISLEPVLPIGFFGTLPEDGEIKNIVIAGNITGENVGGLCGENCGLIFNCHNTAALSGEGNVGGLVGENSGRIVNCHNTAALSGQGVVGGVVGTNSGTITNCFNSGTVCGSGHVGGVCAYNEGTITNCYNSGSVICLKKNCIGGVVGYNSNATSFLANCYNSGSLSRPDGISYGVNGYSWQDNCEYCYYNLETTRGYDARSTGLSTAQMQAVSGSNNALIDLLNGYIDDNGDTTENWYRWTNKAGKYPIFLLSYIYTAENNVLTAKGEDYSTYTLTLTEDGMISAEEIAEWQGAYLELPEIVFDTAANTASITVEGATATVTLAEGALKTHNVKVICGADENGKSYFTDVMPGTAVTVTAGTYEGKLFEKWNAALSVDGSTDETVTFRMPNEDVTVEAQFVDCYPLSVFDGTTLTSEPQKVDYSATVTAPDAPEGMAFKNWTAEGITLDDATASTLTFNMPANAVMLTANYGVLYTVTVSGGTITGAGTSATAFAGETISVTADTVSGHNFTGWTGEGIEFANAASATTAFTMPEADAAVTANFEQIKVAIPTAGTESYTYNGYAQTYQFANEGDVSYYELIGDSTTQTNAGTYTIKAKLTVDGTAWTDGTTADKEYTFVIARQPVDKPIAYNTQYYYDGTEKTFILCKQEGSDYYYYDSCISADKVTIANNTRTAAGTQTVTATPTANYCWPDGTANTLSFTFTVNRYPLPVLNADTRSFIYDKTAQTYTPFSVVGDSLYDFDGALYDLANRTQTDEGSYTVTATLKDNFCWNDDTTAPKEFPFTIKERKLDTYIYYLSDLDVGDGVTCVVDLSHTAFDAISSLKGFKNHPKFEPDMLKDHYMPYLMNAPEGTKATFFIKEDMVTPKNLSEAFDCMVWDEVKMSDLKPNTVYFVFAVVDNPSYPDYQITEIDGLSCFITTDLVFKLQTMEYVTEEEVNGDYGYEIFSSLVDGGISGFLGAFTASKKTKKETKVLIKTEYFTHFDPAAMQAIADIDEGLDFAYISWTEDGKEELICISPNNVDDYKSLYDEKNSLRSAPKRMLAAPAAGPTLITGISNEPAKLTLELLKTMFGTEALDLTALDNAEFKVEMDLELPLEQIKDKNEAALESFKANGLIPEEGTPDDYYSTVTVNSLCYDPATGIVEAESNKYELAAGEKLPAEAVKEIAGFTFDGLYYKDIFDFEKDSKSEDATGDHGMILTQGLVKWDPETDYATRDVALWAIYVKDGAEEPVGYLTSGTTFLDEGSEVTVTLPALVEGMTYGDVINDNADINVSKVSDGKVTVTLNNDVTGDEPFTFTVGVNANKEGVEDPIYYVIVTVNAVDDAECKEEAKTAIEALADDTVSDEVKAIIAEAVASLENANSIEAVNKIVADTAAAVVLQESKEAAIAAIDAAVAEAANSGLEGAAESAAAAAEEAKAAINAATTVEEVNAAKKAGTSAIVAASVCEHCGTKHQNIIFKIICRFIQMIYVMIALFTSIDF